MTHFAVIGHPIKHSFSPVMHSASFQAIGFEGDYTRYDVTPEALEAALRDFAARGFRGLNLTIPLKQTALPFMQSLTPDAARLGAVNTVRIEANATFTGHNTDGAGFLECVKHELGVIPENATVAVVGCGGAGRAIALTLGLSGASVILMNRTHEKAESLAEKMTRLGCRVRVSSDWAVDARTAHLVAQCTPSGLSGNDSPALPAEAFYPGQALCDIVTPPGNGITPTMREALRAGARAINGVGMLVEQGALAFNFWTGLQADKNAMRAAVETALNR